MGMNKWDCPGRGKDADTGGACLVLTLVAPVLCLMSCLVSPVLRFLSCPRRTASGTTHQRRREDNSAIDSRVRKPCTRVTSFVSSSFVPCLCVCVCVCVCVCRLFPPVPGSAHEPAPPALLDSLLLPGSQRLARVAAIRNGMCHSMRNMMHTCVTV